MKHYNIPIFISHFGCPNACVFCNQKKINGVETDINKKDIEEIINSHLETLPKESIKQVAFFGGTFTGLSLQLQQEFLETVAPYIEKKLISGIRISTRPECIDEQILDLLKKYNVKSIELGVQSLDDDVLEATGRKYNFSIVERAAKLIKKYGIELGIQLMVGLPKSTEENDILSAKKAISLSPDIARIYPTLVIKDTDLERQYHRGEYKELSLDEAVQRTKKIYSLMELADIKIIRVGLQPSDDLRSDGNIIVGPFHSAFRELVEQEIYTEFLEKIFAEDGYLEIFSNEKNISKIVGQHKKNKIKFKPKFNIKIDNSLSLSEIIVNEKVYARKDILGVIDV